MGRPTPLINMYFSQASLTLASPSYIPGPETTSSASLRLHISLDTDPIPEERPGPGPDPTSTLTGIDFSLKLADQGVYKQSFGKGAEISPGFNPNMNIKHLDKCGTGMGKDGIGIGTGT